MRGLWLFLFATGCASLMGLDELETLPADFPIAIEGEVGHITAMKDGRQIAVDAVFPSEEKAREGWQALEAAAKANGFEKKERSTRDKKERVLLQGPKGKIELACCPQRADRQWLVYVTWWKTE